VIGAGLWFGGLLPRLPGIGREAKAASKAGDAKAGELPSYIELPEIIANLNTGGRRNSFVKLHARIELAKEDDRAAITAVLPRLQDLFQTYLRETRPEELRGSAGTYRLREELIARANVAAAPARVNDVLFTELLVQ
jgi:flagellar FliL protein